MGIGRVLSNHKEDVLYMFLKNVGIKDFNGVEVLTILEALRIYIWLFRGRLLVESDSANAIHWISKVEGDLCKLFDFVTVALVVSEYRTFVPFLLPRCNFHPF